MRKESLVERLKNKYGVKKLAGKLANTLRPKGTGPMSAHTSVARALYERDSLSSLLAYRDYDEETNMFFMEDSTGVAGCFMCIFQPHMMAGVDLETRIESVINGCPVNSVLNFGLLSSKLVEPRLDMWHKARTENCDNEHLIAMADYRKKFFLDAVRGKSVLPSEELHPRHYYYVLTVRMPYEGDITDDESISAWLHEIKNVQVSTLGGMSSCDMPAHLCDKDLTLMIIREILNNHKDPLEMYNSQNNDNMFEAETVAKGTRIYQEDNGSLSIQSSDGDPNKLTVNCLTVDGFPRENYLPNIMSLFGDPQSTTARIACPFYSFVIIHVLDHEKAEDKLLAKLAMLNKQLMSESQWFLSMMRDLFDRRDDISDMLKLSGGGHRVCRVMMGINLYSEPKYADQEYERLRVMWAERGFRVSKETFISTAVFLSTLPGQYNPYFDPPNKGLQRLQPMLSSNAASLLAVQGDWSGTHPSHGGHLLLSRRGQVSTIDTFQSTTGFNFTVTATTGGGKSFFCIDGIADLLAKGGIVRIIDDGYSYKRLCDLLEGSYLEFDLSNPISLNPFWGLKNTRGDSATLADGSEDQGELLEIIPVLKSMVVQMAFPVGQQTDYDVQLIEKGIMEAWLKHQGTMELKSVYDSLKEMAVDREMDPKGRGLEIAMQLEPFATGRHSYWFNGPPKLKLDGNLVILEMRKLNDDPELRTVILSLLMGRIARDMYKKPRNIPGALLCDEAWAMLGNKQEGNGLSGGVLEAAFRTLRKFYAQAGIITQNYKDSERSDAAGAAFSNSAWKFSLKQRGDSLPFARSKNLIPDSDYVQDLIGTVQRGMGYAEVFVDGGEIGMGLYRMIVDPYTYYVCTTHGPEVEYYEKLIREGKSSSEAIHYMANNIPPMSLGNV